MNKRLGKCEKCEKGGNHRNLYLLGYQNPGGWEPCAPHIYCKCCLEQVIEEGKKHIKEQGYMIDYMMNHMSRKYDPVCDASVLDLAKTSFSNCINCHLYTEVCEKKTCDMYCKDCGKDLGEKKEIVWGNGLSPNSCIRHDGTEYAYEKKGSDGFYCKECALKYN